MPKTEKFKAADLTDQQVRDLIAGALIEIVSENCSCFIQDVNRAKGFLTYQEYDYMSDGGPELYRCTFSIADDYTVTLSTPERVIQTSRYEAAPGDDEDDTGTGGSMMSLTFSLDTAAAKVADGFVERTGKISHTGNYPDKDIEFSEADFDAATTGFAPVPMDVEHTDSLLDGNLGELTSVWRKGAELFGKFRVPAWLQAIFTRDGIAPKVSLSWDRESKRIIKCAWVLNPRVSDAILMAAFNGSKPGGTRSTEAGDEPAPLSPPHAATGNDHIPARKAPMKKSILGYLAALFTQAEKDAPEEKEGEPIVGLSAVATPAAPLLATAAPLLATAAPAPIDMTKNPEYVAMTKRVADLEARDLLHMADTWAEGEISELRALPKDKNRMIAQFCQSARDDAASPATVSFANFDGTVATGSRLDALRADYAARPRTLLTEEFMPDGIEAFALPTNVKMSAEEEADALLDLTPLGKKAKAAKLAAEKEAGK